MTRTATEVLLLAALAALALLGMWLGWRARGRRWAHVGADLPPAGGTPAGTTVLFGPVAVTYLATTPVDAPLERVPARGLGVRAPAEVTVDDGGLLLRRAGADDLYLPADRIVDATTADGMAGTALGRGRLVVVRWRDADRMLQTGLLPRHDDDRAPLTEAVTRLGLTREDPR